MKYIICLLSFLSIYAAKAQQNEWPLINLKEAYTTTTNDINGHYYLFCATKGSRSPLSGHVPRSYYVSKYNYATKSIVKTVALGGDTTQTDSVLIGSGLCATSPAGDKIYYALNRFYLNPTTGSLSRMGLVVMAVDTNLNLILPPRLVKLAPYFGPDTTYGTCSLQSFCLQGNRLFIGYTEGDSVNKR